MTAEIVPFGKYKGQPVEIMLADPSYVEWLTAQPWFRERYGNIYNVVINYGAEPQDTPEHNQMQARFLDDDWCLRLARLLYPNADFDQPRGNKKDAARIREYADFIHLRSEPAGVTGRRFEQRGWDVVYNPYLPVRIVGPHSIHPCICHPCDHSECTEDSTCRGGRWSCRHADHASRSAPTRLEPDRWWSSSKHCTEGCPWGDSDLADWLLRPHEIFAQHLGLIHVECKPQLGDDFPSVLRQVTNYPSGSYNDKRCIIVRRAQFEFVTWDQVSEMFAASSIPLIRESEITEASDPDTTQAQLAAIRNLHIQGPNP